MPKKGPRKKVKKTKKKAAKSSAKKSKGKPAASRKAKPKRRKATAVDFGKLTLRQAIARLSECLEAADYEPVLTGSACAAIYVGASLKPKVINFVIGEYQATELDGTMRGLGFTRSSMNHYESDSSPYDVIFRPPPLAVGDDVVRDIAQTSARPGKFHLLNPTDCVRQRLSMYYRWGDRDAFYEAIEVAKRQKIDMELVKRWSEWEWCTDKYEEFIKALEEEGG